MDGDEYQTELLCGGSWVSKGEACKQLINDAKVSRSKGNEDDKNNLIEVHSKILDNLIQILSVSKSMLYINFF